MGVSEPSPRAVPGQLTFGRYRVERPLGDPSEGRYVARDPDGRAVTLILFDGGDDPATFAERLKNDPVLGKHDHPHLMPVLDAGADIATRRVYVVLPELEGTDCHRIIAERGPIDPSAAVRIVFQASRGLEALRAAGARLCELSPSDLVIVYGTKRSATVRVLPLTDARRHNAQSGSLSGTDMVPARIFRPSGQDGPAEPASERSAVASLGACLYWMLCGAAPEADSSQSGAVRSVQENAPWLSPGLTIAVHLALQTDPAMRWPTLAALGNALQPFSGGLDQLARSDLAPIDKQVRRRVAERADPRALARRGDDGDSNTNTASSTGLFGKLKQEPQGLNALVGQTLAGRWRVLRAVGRGGMGAVFEVEGPEGKHAAAKLIDRHLVGQDEETYKRFVREAKAATSIKNPHVVETIEAGIDPELKAPYIIMELLNGVDLKSMIREQGALQAEPVVRVILQAAHGIAAAHGKQIVHRDIKPANLFLHEEADGNITVKVCDFGIAKRTSEVDGDQTGSHDLTRTGGMLGSPAYMSPEQATNARNVDHRTDIWSLCISMYEALSGTKPWAGRSALGEIIVAICTQEVPPLARVAPWLDRGLAEVVHRGLRSDLADRWQSVDELILALEPYAGGSEAFKYADLVAVTPEQRALQPSSIPPALSNDQDAATVIGGVPGKPGARALAEPAPPPARRSNVAWFLAGGVVLVVAAVVIAGRARPPSAEGSIPTATAPVPTSSVVPVTTRARVKIVPASAKVTVDGRDTPVVDGSIELSGPPGTAFGVEVRGEEDAHALVSVVLAREGRAVPDSVVAEKIVDKPVGKGRVSTRPGPGVGSAKSTTEGPAGKPAPSATPAPSHNPEFKNEW